MWPDNDAAGFKAADELRSELKKVGVHKLRLVDRALLSKHFPEKWDLADPLPKGKESGIVTDLLLRAETEFLSLEDTSHESQLSVRKLEQGLDSCI